MSPYRFAGTGFLFADSIGETGGDRGPGAIGMIPGVNGGAVGSRQRRNGRPNS
jgi:hypothetical protein